MKKTENSPNAIHYYWYNKAIQDPLNLNAESDWAPFDNYTSDFIEENYLKGNIHFEMQIENQIYSFDLKEYTQCLKEQHDLCRLKTRTTRNEIYDQKRNIRVVRKNRFVNLIETLEYENNSIKVDN